MSASERYHRYGKADAVHLNQALPVAVALVVRAAERAAVDILAPWVGVALDALATTDPADRLAQSVFGPSSACPVAAAAVTAACARALLADVSGAPFHLRLQHARIFRRKTVCDTMLSPGSVVRLGAECVKESLLFSVVGFFNAAGGVAVLARRLTAEVPADLSGAPASYDARLDTHVRVVRPELVVFRADAVFAPLFAPDHISTFGGTPAAAGEQVRAAVVAGRVVISAALERCRHG